LKIQGDAAAINTTPPLPGMGSRLTGHLGHR
jgi:hypothetical protein